MSGYIGTQPVPQATQTRDSFTATSGQTSFATGGYTPNFLDVYLNGVKLASADYTASNGSDVVLASGAATGDILEVVAFTTFNSASSSIDDNGNATAITINASESVLVGKSVDTLATSGTALFANGQIDSSVDGNYVAKFNRKSSDGTIIELRKDTTGIVGSIGVAFGDNLMVTGKASGHLGIEFAGAGLLPTTNTGGNSNNVFDLGGAGQSWKDLYLSGGIHLGGTGTLNKLDDYEYGSYTVTATPETSGSQTMHAAYRTLTYTKIGRLVKVQGNVYISSNSSAAGSTLFNLPFASSMNEQSKSFSVLGVGSYPTPSSTSLMSASGSMRAYKAGGGPLSAGSWYSIDFTYIVNV